MTALVGILQHALMITVLVFVMMLIVDFVDIVSQKRLTEVIKGGLLRQYLAASALGATPGCLGAFMNVSLYVHGLLTFGALTGAMIATSGDEAFVMLARFPGTALVLFALLFVVSLPFAWLTDRFVRATKYKPCDPCYLQEVHIVEETPSFRWAALGRNLTHLSPYRHPFLLLFAAFFVAVAAGVTGPQVWDWKRLTLMVLLGTAWVVLLAVSEHYLRDHVWAHLVKSHIWRVFLWTFFALLVVHLGLHHWNLKDFVSNNVVWMLLLGALVAVIPESGPHLLFVMLFAEGVIPFSVLFASSFVQDGHGMLPLLSYTLRDSILIKGLNLAFGLAVGGALYAVGL